jgi:hypothetical protein
MPPPTIKAALTLTWRQARAIWWQRQGLGATRYTAPGSALAAGGWLHTAGGSGPYLAMLARGFGPAVLNSAVFDRSDLLEVPGPRGSKMLVPHAEGSLAIAASRLGRQRETEKFRAAVITEPAAYQAYREALLAVLDAGEATADRLRDAVPRECAPMLPEAARKMGVSSMQAFALWNLMVAGEVERRYVGRLDAKDYVYRRMRPLPAVPDTEDGLHAALAERYFKWAGPATVKDFAAFLDIPQRDAKAAIARCDLAPVDIEGETAWLASDEVDAASRATEPPAGQWRLLPVRDNYLSLHRGLVPLFDDDDGRRALPGSERPMADLPTFPYYAIVESGRLLGAWDWDPDEGRIVWILCRRLDGDRLEGFLAALDTAEAVIGAELGDLRFYAMDSKAGRKKRLATLRG